MARVGLVLKLNTSEENEYVLVNPIESMKIHNCNSKRW